MPSYPDSAIARDRFILERRSPRPAHDPWRHQGIIIEDECAADGCVARGATIFLTGRECPWRCVMCDLWRHTTTTDTPRGAIPGQIASAREELGERWSRERSSREPSGLVSQVKLYNAGSFFDPRAVPDEDYDAVAAELAGLARVVVESHPALVGSRVDQFAEALDHHRSGAAAVQLEVAMGLETAHTEALERLNKRMTVEEYARAAEYLRGRGVSVRTFLLISPPFVPPDEQHEWLARSIDVAFSCGSSVVSLIPTRSGNGAMDGLAAGRTFSAPRLEDIERSIESALAIRPARGRVFLDLWDLQRFSDCPRCYDARRARLDAINLQQRLVAASACSACGFGVAS